MRIEISTNRIVDMLVLAKEQIDLIKLHPINKKNDGFINDMYGKSEQTLHIALDMIGIPPDNTGEDVPRGQAVCRDAYMFEFLELPNRTAIEKFVEEIIETENNNKNEEEKQYARTASLKNATN